jgi:O-antigen ligase
MDVSLTNTNIITFTTVSIFLPYVLTGIVLAFLSVYIIIKKDTRQRIFVHNGSNTLKLLFAYILVIPFIYKNWIGLAVGVGIILAIILGLFMRSVMTSRLYEKILTLICVLSLTSAGYAMIERLVNIISDSRHSHRIAAVFSHPNYFGTIIGTVIIICAYKILTNQEHKWFYFVVAFINVISMYLCKSMFVWVEVFLGIVVLLVILKKHVLLVLWLGAAVLGSFLIFVLDFNIIPRLSDVEVTVRLRGQIWRLAMEQIKASPLFGHGFMSFYYLFNSTYRNRRIPHSHSIYLDMLLNFGVVGTGLFLWFIIKYYVTLIKDRMKENNIMITSLIVAVVVAALAHGATDLTLLWIQTFPLLMIILSGLGAQEKTERHQITVES